MTSVMFSQLNRLLWIRFSYIVYWHVSNGLGWLAQPWARGCVCKLYAYYLEIFTSASNCYVLEMNFGLRYAYLSRKEHVWTKKNKDNEKFNAWCYMLISLYITVSTEQPMWRCNSDMACYIVKNGTWRLHIQKKSLFQDSVVSTCFWNMTMLLRTCWMSTTHTASHRFAENSKCITWSSSSAFCSR